jgi:hypothetical protein
MASEGIKNNSEALASYLVLKKLIMPTTQTEAYKLKLVDGSGNIIKVPETEDEKNALGMLDRLCFELRKIIGTKMNTFKDFLYLINTKDDYINNINSKNSILKRAEVMRLNKELSKLSENYDIPLSYFFGELLKEQMKSEV